MKRRRALRFSPNLTRQRWPAHENRKLSNKRATWTAELEEKNERAARSRPSRQRTWHFLVWVRARRASCPGGEEEAAETRRRERHDTRPEDGNDSSGGRGRRFGVRRPGKKNRATKKNKGARAKRRVAAEEPDMRRACITVKCPTWSGPLRGTKLQGCSEAINSHAARRRLSPPPLPGARREGDAATSQAGQDDGPARACGDGTQATRKRSGPISPLESFGGTVVDVTLHARTLS